MCAAAWAEAGSGRFRKISVVGSEASSKFQNVRDSFGVWWRGLTKWKQIGSLLVPLKLSTAGDPGWRGPAWIKQKECRANPFWLHFDTSGHIEKSSTSFGLQNDTVEQELNKLMRYVESLTGLVGSGRAMMADGAGLPKRHRSSRTSRSGQIESPKL